MGERGWYNGYNDKERKAKLKDLNRLIAQGILPQPPGPCQLCGDPEVPVEYHDEDYSLPYLWTQPALLALCRNCHRDKLHKRFFRPAAAWHAFIAHIRRGGYARDLKDKATKTEVAACQAVIEKGERFSLRVLRPYRGVAGHEWFAHLRLDPESLTDPLARPRPCPGSCWMFLLTLSKVTSDKRVLALGLIEERFDEARQSLNPAQRSERQPLHFVLVLHEALRDLALHMRPDLFVGIELRRVESPRVS